MSVTVLIGFSLLVLLAVGLVALFASRKDSNDSVGTADHDDA